MASDGRTVSGDGWRHMVGRWVGMGGVIWWDGGWGWVASYGRTEDGVG